MTIVQTIKTQCDECGKTIADDAPSYTITFQDPPQEQVEGQPLVLLPLVTLHFHEKCFDRTTALQAQRIEKARDS